MWEMPSLGGLSNLPHMHDAITASCDNDAGCGEGRKPCRRSRMGKEGPVLIRVSTKGPGHDPHVLGLRPV